MPVHSASGPMAEDPCSHPSGIVDPGEPTATGYGSWNYTSSNVTYHIVGWYITEQTDEGPLNSPCPGSVVTSSVASDSLLEVFSPNGTLESDVSVSGSPTSISFSKNGKFLYVDDPTTGIISGYPFPEGGSPVFSMPTESSGGTPLTPLTYAAGK